MNHESSHPRRPSNSRANPVRIPNESAEYRAARTALLAEEIELRRHIERVAAQRRALPPGGPVVGDYRFEARTARPTSPACSATRRRLAIYSYMFGPQRARPCPMCTNLLGAWEGNAADIGQSMSLVVVARSPIERLIAWKRRARLEEPPPRPATSTAPIHRDYFGLTPDGSESPALNVFTRRDGTHPTFLVGRDDRLDRRPRPGPARRTRSGPAVDGARLTPEGGREWYPQLEYSHD